MSCFAGGWLPERERERERERNARKKKSKRIEKEEEEEAHRSTMMIRKTDTNCLIYILFVSMKQPGRVPRALGSDRRLVGVNDPILKVLSGAVCALERS